MRQRKFFAPQRVYARRYPPTGAFQTIEDDGLRLRMHLVERGDLSSDEAVVLVHGASGNVRDFSMGLVEQISEHAVGQGRRVIAIDRPGFGHSERGPGEAHRPEVQARRMRAAIAARGVKRVVLLGHSLGAASALAWLLDAPETVCGLVSLSGVSHPWKGSAGLSYDLLSLPLIGWSVAHAASRLVSEKRAKGALTSIFAPEEAPNGYADMVGVGLALRPSTLLANGRDVGRLSAILEEQSARYRSIRAPVEIVHGAEDVIVRPEIHAFPLKAACATAELTMLPGTGHMPHHTRPAEVLQALNRIIIRSAKIADCEAASSAISP